MFEDLLLTKQVVVALRTAAVARPQERPLGTTDVLLTLMHGDVTNPWDYVTLHTGDDGQLAARRQEDPADGAPGRWEGSRSPRP